MNDLTLAEIKILLESLINAAERGDLDEETLREVITEIEALLESEGGSDV
jgi:hypothetical protein